MGGIAFQMKYSAFWIQSLYGYDRNGRMHNHGTGLGRLHENEFIFVHIRYIAGKIDLAFPVELTGEMSVV